jgi:hypothetical protein
MFGKLELPSLEEAQQNLNTVLAQRFLDKLASLGYQPQTDEAKLAALQAGVMMDNVPDEDEPDPGADPYVAATEKLAGLLRQYAPQAGDSEEHERQKMAVALATEPTFFTASAALIQELSKGGD